MTSTLIDGKAATVDGLLVDRPWLLHVLKDAIGDAVNQSIGSDDDCDSCYDVQCDNSTTDEECEDHARGRLYAQSYQAAHEALRKLLGSEDLKPVVVDELQIGEFKVQIMSDGAILRQSVLV